MLILFLIVQIYKIIKIQDYYLIEYIFYILQTLGFLVFSTYLFICHTYFILNNKTTYQHLTTNRFVRNYHNLLFYTGEGILLIRKFTRIQFNIYNKLFQPKRNQIIQFNQLIHYEMPSFIEQQKLQQKLQQQLMNETYEKNIQEDKTKTYQSELGSEKFIINKLNQKKQQTLEQQQQLQELDFKFLKIESDSNGEQNQLSHESSQRGEKKELKIYGMSQSTHNNEINKFKGNSRQIETVRNKEYNKLEFQKKLNLNTKN